MLTRWRRQTNQRPDSRLRWARSRLIQMLRYSSYRRESNLAGKVRPPLLLRCDLGSNLGRRHVWGINTALLLDSTSRCWDRLLPLLLLDCAIDCNVQLLQYRCGLGINSKRRKSSSSADSRCCSSLNIASLRFFTSACSIFAFVEASSRCCITRGGGVRIGYATEPDGETNGDDDGEVIE